MMGLRPVSKMGQSHEEKSVQIQRELPYANLAWELELMKI
jgi:hypothetical protein